MDALATTTAGAITTGNTWNAKFLEFLDYIDRTPQTHRAYTLAIKKFYLWTQENNITQPTRENVKLYRNYLLANYKATTVQMYMQGLRKFFKWTENAGYYPNIADNIHTDAPTTDIHKRDAFTAEQAGDILTTLKANDKSRGRDFAMLHLAFNGALRVCEIARANIGDLRERQGATVLYIKGKKRADKADYIFVAPEVEKAIRNYLATRPVCEEDAPLFASNDHKNAGARLTTRSISRAFKQAFRQAGYDDARLTAHSVRHTAITQAVEELAEQNDAELLLKVQQFARHRNVNTTMIYIHDREHRVNDCGQLIANRFAQFIH